MKVSCLILTRNEEAKIHIAVTHALKWADEVVIVDKESTDKTCQIARDLGARIVTVPFTRQGHEDMKDFASHASHDWVWGFASHEVPTRKLIEAGKRLMADDVDLIMVPMYYYSFGVHHDQSPWSGGHQPRLYNRTRITFTGTCHDPIRATRVQIIPYLPEQFVLHQTHATADRFMISHSDYMINEAANGKPEEVYFRAMKTAVKFDQVFKANPELMPQALGWKIYWFGVALHAYERMNPGVVEGYATRAEEMLLEWADYDIGAL